MKGPPDPRAWFDVLVPVLDDWPSLESVLQGLDDVFAERGWTGSVLIVDDGSSQVAPPLGFAPRTLRSVRILKLRRNLGHQRAICVGLCQLEREDEGRAVIVMDGDGQDRPGDVPELVAAYERTAGRRAVFAGRTKRPEGIVFKIFYGCYKLLHRLLTGRGIRIGNFSILSPGAVGATTTSPEAWSHYAAAVSVSRVPISIVDIPRAQRLRGSPRMNFVGLVTHGLSAISVYGDVVSVRLLIAAAAATVAGIALVLAIWLPQVAADAGMATGTIWITVLAAVFLTQVNVGAVIVALLIHHARRTASVIPRRDFEHFVAAIERWDGARFATESGPSPSPPSAG